MTKRRKAILALVFTMAIWGVSATMIKYTLRFISPFTLLFFRFFVVCLVVTPFLSRELKQNPFAKKDVFKLIVLSLFGITFNLTLTFLGFGRTTALEGLVITTVGPIMTIWLGMIILKEKIVKFEKIGLMIIFTGSMIPLIAAYQNFRNGTSFNLLGDLLLLMGALSWTVFAILSKELIEKYKPLPVTLVTFYVGLATFLPLMILEQIFDPLASQMNLWYALPGIFYLAILSSITGYILYEYGLSIIEASEADVFNYLMPLFALPSAYLLLGEVPSPTLILGGIIIALGVIVYNKGSSLQRQHTRRSKV